jgi:hypothetical protein
MLVHASRHCFAASSICEWNEFLSSSTVDDYCPFAASGMDGLTFSNIWSESLKSVSMASMSASLGRRVDMKGKRPTFLCTRCMV